MGVGAMVNIAAAIRWQRARSERVRSLCGDMTAVLGASRQRVARQQIGSLGTGWYACDNTSIGRPPMPPQEV